MNLQVNEFCYLLISSAYFCDDSPADFEDVTDVLFLYAVLREGFARGYGK